MTPWLQTLRWMKLIAIIGVVAGLVVVFSPILTMFGGALIAPHLAYALAPPPYPDSQLIDLEQISGSSGLTWEKETYHTSDALPDVLRFMEAHFAGFKESETGDGYYNGRWDTSFLGQRAAENVCRSQVDMLCYPGASVSINPAHDRPGTIIEIWVSWSVP